MAAAVPAMAAAIEALHEAVGRVKAAVRGGSAGALERLLEGDAAARLCVSEPDESGSTPLHEAAGSGLVEACGVLAAHGANLEARDLEGFTPALWAAAMGRGGACRALLERGARREALDAYGSTLLHRAADGGLAGLCEELLDGGGFDVATRNAIGETALFYAARSGSGETCSLLVRRGAAPNARSGVGETPLHAASSREAMAALLAHGAAPDARDQALRTPLHCAATSGEAGMVEELLRHGADPNARTAQGATPLAFVATGVAADVPAACEALLRWGADARAADAAGSTPLDAVRDELAAAGGAHAPGGSVLGDTADLLGLWLRGAHPVQVERRAAVAAATAAGLVPDVAAICGSYLAIEPLSSARARRKAAAAVASREPPLKRRRA